MKFIIEVNDEDTGVQMDGDRELILWNLARLFADDKYIAAIMKVALAQAELVEFKPNGGDMQEVTEA